jgi:hypothetical protein
MCREHRTFSGMEGKGEGRKQGKEKISNSNEHGLCIGRAVMRWMRSMPYWLRGRDLAAGAKYDGGLGGASRASI